MIPKNIITNRPQGEVPANRSITQPISAPPPIPPQQFRQHPVACAVIRIGTLHLRLVALFFPLACSLQPLIERVDPRIFTDGFPGSLVLAHAAFLIRRCNTSKSAPAKSAAPLGGGYPRVNRKPRLNRA